MNLVHGRMDTAIEDDSCKTLCIMTIVEMSFHQSFQTALPLMSRIQPKLSKRSALIFFAVLLHVMSDMQGLASVSTWMLLAGHPHYADDAAKLNTMRSQACAKQPRRQHASADKMHTYVHAIALPKPGPSNARHEIKAVTFTAGLLG